MKPQNQTQAQKIVFTTTIFIFAMTIAVLSQVVFSGCKKLPECERVIYYNGQEIDRDFMSQIDKNLKCKSIIPDSGYYEDVVCGE